jgi:hypothetical protein
MPMRSEGKSGGMRLIKEMDSINIIKSERSNGDLSVYSDMT